MNRLLILTAFIAACSSAKEGPAGPQGATGAQGAAGTQGTKGDAGANGTCDASECTSVTSLNGLSGGTINGAVTISGGVTISSSTPSGIVTAAGNAKNSQGGFWCGTTAPVDGTFYGAGAAYDTTQPYSVMPKRRAKKLCVDTCAGNAAAHPCFSSEIQNAQLLNGGGGLVANSAIPMPPTGSGWVLSPNPLDSCGDLNSTAGSGIIYNSSSTDEGSFGAQACNTNTTGLYCCL